MRLTEKRVSYYDGSGGYFDGSGGYYVADEDVFPRRAVIAVGARVFTSEVFTGRGSAALLTVAGRTRSA